MMVPSQQPSALLIGMGSEHRGDDAVGLMVARTLREIEFPSFVRVMEFQGEATGLLEMWEHADVVFLIDAVSAQSSPGTILTVDLHREKLPSTWCRRSSHTLGLAEALELGQTLDRLPPRLVLHGIQSESFRQGELTPSVRASIRKVVALIEVEVLSLASHLSVHQ